VLTGFADEEPVEGAGEVIVARWDEKKTPRTREERVIFPHE